MQALEICGILCRFCYYLVTTHRNVPRQCFLKVFVAGKTVKIVPRQSNLPSNPTIFREPYLDNNVGMPSIDVLLLTSTNKQLSFNKKFKGSKSAI